eukprot:CAMPEP_0119380824 /NCGR_PEP_ID=MMETSP1334-20130426/57945_1 /TAXON_ID=127549 /ORGANISM="Calcidiscus leptoporus, Strain RCC1130" /LENGTH=894 /DNA_ID=CAMNT_0007400763 /DNA_START=118 /DNA_END=2802 /DNA_ORIENTATION=+
MSLPSYRSIALRMNLPEFTKVGLRVDKQNVVLGVHPGSPAEVCGLIAGDKIEAIDGKLVDTAFTVQQAIRERESNEPLLQVRRKMRKPAPLMHSTPIFETEEADATAAELPGSEPVAESPLLELRMWLPPKTKAGMRVEKNEVLAVHSGSAAERAGLQPGDLITMVDGTPVSEEYTVVAAIAKRATNEPVLHVHRGAGPLWAEVQRTASDIRLENERERGTAAQAQMLSSQAAAELGLQSDATATTVCAPEPMAGAPQDDEFPPDETMFRRWMSILPGSKIGLKLDKNVVAGIHPGSPAATAGLLVGDVIEAVDGKQLHAGTNVPKLLSQRVGNEVELLIRREDAPLPERSGIDDDVDACLESGFEELCIEIGRDPAGELGMSMYGDGRLLAVRDNGAAAAAGLRVGDTIAEVDGVSVSADNTIPKLMPTTTHQFSLLVRRPNTRTVAAMPAVNWQSEAAAAIKGRGGVGGMMARFMANASATAASVEDENHLKEIEAAQRKRAVQAATARPRFDGTFEQRSAISDVVGAFEEGSIPQSTRAVVQVTKRGVQTRSMGVTAMIGSGEALVKMLVASLGDADIRAFVNEDVEGGFAPKRVLGQSAVGSVVALAANVREFQLGDMVVVMQGDESLGSTGCQAGYVQVRDAVGSLIKVPTDMEVHVEDALLAAETLGPGMSLARMAVGGGASDADAESAKRCYAVLGCSALGLMAVAALRLLAGDKAVVLAIDAEPRRRELALRFEASQALPYDKATEAGRQLSHGRGFDGVIDASGKLSAFELAYSLVGSGGVLASMSAHHSEPLPLSPRKLCAKGLRLSFGCKQNAAKQLFPTALKLIRAKRFPILDIVTHRLSIDDAQKAYDLASMHPDESLAIVFYPSGQQPEGAARALFSSLD